MNNQYKNTLSILLIVILLLLLLFFVKSGMCMNITQRSEKEGFNEQTGKYCLTCKDKTLNQCTNCFNCGYCVDKWGNGMCVGGDLHGPYNNETCARWYHGDPFSVMLQKNKADIENHKCSYGPTQASRII